MTQVVSRVNGLKIAIPADARNIIHRFAISGGGNELVFEPITRKTFDQSKGSEKNPMGLGAGQDETPDVTEQVTLSENVVDEPEEAPKKKTTRKPRKTAKAAEDEAGDIL